MRTASISDQILLAVLCAYGRFKFSICMPIHSSLLLLILCLKSRCAANGWNKTKSEEKKEQKSAFAWKQINFHFRLFCWYFWLRHSEWKGFLRCSVFADCDMQKCICIDRSRPWDYCNGTISPFSTVVCQGTTMMTMKESPWSVRVRAGTLVRVQMWISEIKWPLRVAKCVKNITYKWNMHTFDFFSRACFAILHLCFALCFLFFVSLHWSMAITSKPGYFRTLFMLVQMRARLYFCCSLTGLHISILFRSVFAIRRRTTGHCCCSTLSMVLLLQKFLLKSILFKRKHVQLVEFLFLIEYRQNKYAYDVVCFWMCLPVCVCVLFLFFPSSFTYVSGFASERERKRHEHTKFTYSSRCLCICKIVIKANCVIYMTTQNVSFLHFISSDSSFFRWKFAANNSMREQKNNAHSYKTEWRFLSIFFLHSA